MLAAAHVFPHAGRGGRALARVDRSGVTGTDVVLTVTEMLRKAKVVGKFVEFFGEGASNLVSLSARPSPTWRPSTRHHGVLPGRRADLPVLLATGRPKAKVTRCAPTSRRSRCSGSEEGPVRLHPVLELDLASVKPRRRPQAPAGSHRAPEAQGGVRKILQDPSSAGYGKTKEEVGKRLPPDRPAPPAVPHVAGGGEQASETAPEVSGRYHPEGHQPAHRSGDDDQPAHADGARPGGPPDEGAGGHRARRRAHRRDHLLHQHQQSVVMLAAGIVAKKAVEKASKSGRGEDLASAGVARGSRATWKRPACSPPGQARLHHGGLRLHHLHRQLGPARAARRAIGEQA